MGNNDIAIIGLGALALFMFRKDISATVKPLGQVTGAIGDVAQTGSKSLKNVSAVTEVIPTIAKATQQRVFRESGEASQRSLKRQEADIVNLSGETRKEAIEVQGEVARKEITQKALTSATQTVSDAGSDIKSTFKSIFRPTPTQITTRRASLKSTVSRIGSFLNPFD